YTRLLRDRIIFLGTPVDDDVANAIIAQLLFCAADNPEQDINLYINSPGGLVSSGLAIYDTIQYIQPDVATCCMGMAASMAAILLSAGKPGKRTALEHSRVMIHQPVGGIGGQASDIAIHAQEMIKVRGELNNILARHTKKDVDSVKADTDRNFFMSATEARDYGIIDDIIKPSEDGEDAD
ncbi:MAG: ATP-dependent Clp protease proteolytic subunit, partial [Gemmatimonadetes bacterium]|nr:ATP-dependent Clp protease proteolytic subunit [Gemmatimonadota bacterium]